jgi:hypothetical protein
MKIGAIRAQAARARVQVQVNVQVHVRAGTGEAIFRIDLGYWGGKAASGDLCSAPATVLFKTGCEVGRV